jgi:hypothetical protein
MCLASRLEIAATIAASLGAVMTYSISGSGSANGNMLQLINKLQIN